MEIKKEKMKEIKHKKKMYAKKVIDLGDSMIPREIDRTEARGKIKFDVDVRSLTSMQKSWIYWGSHHSIEKCMKEFEKSDFTDFTDLRIVESKTGLILKQFKL